MDEQQDKLVNSRFKYPESVHEKVVEHQLKLRLRKKKSKRVTVAEATIDLIKLGIKHAGV